MGAKYLVKANLPQLETLELCTITQYSANCLIGNEGTKHLGKGNWSNLRKLDLRKLLIYSGSNFIKNQMFLTLPETNWKSIRTVYTEHQVSDEIAVLNLCVQDIDVPFVAASERMFQDIIRTVRVKYSLFYTNWL